MSRAERFALVGALILVLVQALVAVSSPAGHALEYQRAALAAEPWRLLTGHWVHINWPHVLVNATAWFVVARLFAPELTPWRQAVVLVVASVAISAGLAWIYPGIAWYRGFSGVLHALFFAGATAWLAGTLRAPQLRAPARLWLPAALFFGGWIKVLLEQPVAGATPFVAWLGAPTVPQAHLVGAVCGTMLSVALAPRHRSAAPALARDQRE
jgi:rhomboid family GlyGly-CTERM serine protease